MPIRSHLGGQHFDPETIRLAIESRPLALGRVHVAHVWLPGTTPLCYRPRRGDDCMMTSTKSLIIAPVILLLSVPALAQQPDARRGSALAREHCAPCHAIDNTSESPRAAAPPFRELRLKYAISDLQRPLTQGPHTRFQFEPSQIESLMAYLKTLDR